MNVSKSPLRRVSALAAGSLIGLAGVAVFATPAFAHHSTVTVKSDCDQSKGKWVVEWTVNAIGDGESPNQTAQFTKVDLTPAGTTLSNPKLVVDGEPIPAGQAITAIQLVDGDAESASLKVAAKWANPNYEDGRTGEASVTFPNECKKKDTPPSQEPSTPPSTEPSTPSEEPSTPPTLGDVPAEPTLEETCDTISLGVDNTKNSTPVKIDYETSKGEKRTLTVAPGKEGSEKFSASAGFRVKVTYTVEYKGTVFTATYDVPWQEPAEGCDDGEGGGLPVTGAAAGGVAAGAAGLLAIGGALFFVARRRKVKFTA
ncbi:hypothetical protein Q0Z83_099390 [Actinoplanes sichuanensis]|uniref:LPXTG cell wall anchor domain-containing protein n=1 Tax=Actinoplanes sichuanensis TaxID=512349 RepID=A0ABW4AFT0_9ACTN|nr:LPXTG cell wall anchor domain-containing protein [Actinoplanes sichuanensis]BEL11748.1 hypothetical protein Q0Z83_099390 [Actinoplanes sichuanensis]